MRYTLRQIKDGTGFAADAMFETVEDYNGWTNRETWALALWINNDQGWQESVLDAVREAEYTTMAETFPHTEWSDEDEARSRARQAGEVVKEHTESVFDWDNYGDEHGGQRCVPALLLSALEDIGSLYRVDWDEIGAAFLTDLAEQSEDAR